MRVEEQVQITRVLSESEEPLTFEEIQERTSLRGQDLRSGLRELIHDEGGVYVHGVEDKKKRYDLK